MDENEIIPKISVRKSPSLRERGTSLRSSSRVKVQPQPTNGKVEHTANWSSVLSQTENLKNVELMDELTGYILDLEAEPAILLLNSMDSSAIQYMETYRVVDKYTTGSNSTALSDVTLLQLASSYSVSTDLLSLMAQKCPALLRVQRVHPYEGQTPLHTLVSKENVQAVTAILEQQSPEQLRELLTVSTNTDAMSAVNATVMLGGLPLSIAALTFNLEMVDLLLKHGGKLNDANDRGDTVFHSLVRFSALYPEKEVKVKEVMNELHQRLKLVHEPRSVWLRENKDGMTALKLAAQCSQPLLFNLILSLKGVYCDLDIHDGLFDSLLYDITDIDPVAMRHVLQLQQEASAEHLAKHSQVASANVEGLPDTLKRVGSTRSARSAQGSVRSESGGAGDPGLVVRQKEISILEIIYETQRPEDAFKILENYVVGRVIDDKWLKYRWLVITWTILHLLFMIWITVYAVFKARMSSEYTLPLSNATLNTTLPTPSSPPPHAGTRSVNSGGEQFVVVTAVLTSLWSLMMFSYELTRLVRDGRIRYYFNSLVYHHNGFYRLQLIALAACLLVDAAILANWHLAGGPASDVPLIVALILGWWFTTFFLRPWRKFSYFTVMLQEVLIGDMLRFSTIFIPMLIAFSVAMHITYLPLDGPLPEEFRSVGRTVMTMFKLMLGLSDIGVLYEAPQEWLSILLFVLYVLLTYSLMLNALIALMSNTCSIVSQNRDDQWKLQRLSMVLFLQESLGMFKSFLEITGEPRDIKVQDFHKMQTTTKTRYVMKISTVRGAAGAATLQGAVRRMLSDDSDDDDDCPITAAADDMYDLLAALNYQRKEKDRPDHNSDDDNEQVERKRDGGGTETDNVDKGDDNGGGMTVMMRKRSVKNTYLNIRSTLHKCARHSVALSPRPVASGGGRGDYKTDGYTAQPPPRPPHPPPRQDRKMRTGETAKTGDVRDPKIATRPTWHEDIYEDDEVDDDDDDDDDETAEEEQPSTHATRQRLQARVMDKGRRLGKKERGRVQKLPDRPPPPRRSPRDQGTAGRAERDGVLGGEGGGAAAERRTAAELRDGIFDTSDSRFHMHIKVQEQ